MSGLNYSFLGQNLVTFSLSLLISKVGRCALFLFLSLVFDGVINLISLSKYLMVLLTLTVSQDDQSIFLPPLFLPQAKSAIRQKIMRNLAF